LVKVSLSFFIFYSMLLILTSALFSISRMKFIEQFYRLKSFLLPLQLVFYPLSSLSLPFSVSVTVLVLVGTLSKIKWKWYQFFNNNFLGISWSWSHILTILVKCTNTIISPLRSVWFDEKKVEWKKIMQINEWTLT
jgi:hypothetical protein